MKKVLKEFKEFISRGSVVDLAVGVIVGGAFSKIVTSLVNDVLMPIIGVILGGLNFSTLSIKFGEATIKYGAFIQNVIEETLACFGFLFLVWIGISWVGVIAEQPLAEWNFFKIFIELMLQYR